MSARAAGLEKAMAAGLGYILSIQAHDGSWVEWELQPGSSATWTTAYVGYKLRSLPCDLARQAAPHLAAAARWQSQNAFADGGWGYNAAARSDADSTAYAILFLASAGQPVPDAAYALLAGFQCADGGFATYRPTGPRTSWDVSHPDVTPVALRAMLTHPAPDRDLVERGIKYVLGQRTPLGLWNSFWWSSCLYGTEANLSFLDSVGLTVPSAPALAQIQPASAFETAMLASSLLHADDHAFATTISLLVDALVRQQRPDGSWETEPILRVTWRDVYEPWVVRNGGVLYAELNRLFTTATVLHALARVCVF